MKQAEDVKESCQEYEKVNVSGTTVLIPQPVPNRDAAYVQREELLEPALACWHPVDGLEPLSFRLFGPPGTGKNALVYHLAQDLGKDLYVLNGHEELGPEDIACSARMNPEGMIEYVASPLFAAMLRGNSVFLFDEIGKAPPSALNPLASVLDERRTLSSVLAGIRLTAHEDFLFCAALNEDEETAGKLPEFLRERLLPAIHVGCPPVETLRRILGSHHERADPRWIETFLEQYCHEPLSPRAALKTLALARSLEACHRGRAKSAKRPTKREIRAYLRSAVALCKGDGASSAPSREPMMAEASHEQNPVVLFSERGARKTTH